MIIWGLLIHLYSKGCMYTHTLINHFRFGEERLRETIAMAAPEFKHLAIIKFKEGVVVDDIIKGMEKLVSQISLIKSLEWGQDLEGHEMLTQGFTHAFTLTFKSKEDYIAYEAHPNHLEYAAGFSASIEKCVVLNYPAVLLKQST